MECFTNKKVTEKLMTKACITLYRMESCCTPLDGGGGNSLERFEMWTLGIYKICISEHLEYEMGRYGEKWDGVGKYRGKKKIV